MDKDPRTFPGLAVEITVYLTHGLGKPRDPPEEAGICFPTTRKSGRKIHE